MQPPVVPHREAVSHPIPEAPLVASSSKLIARITQDTLGIDLTRVPPSARLLEDLSIDWRRLSHLFDALNRQFTTNLLAFDHLCESCDYRGMPPEEQTLRERLFQFRTAQDLLTYVNGHLTGVRSSSGSCQFHVGHAGITVTNVQWPHAASGRRTGLIYVDDEVEPGYRADATWLGRLLHRADAQLPIAGSDAPEPSRLARAACVQDLWFTYIEEAIAVGKDIEGVNDAYYHHAAENALWKGDTAQADAFVSASYKVPNRFYLSPLKYGLNAYAILEDHSNSAGGALGIWLELPIRLRLFDLQRPATQAWLGFSEELAGGATNLGGSPAFFSSLLFLPGIFVRAPALAGATFSVSYPFGAMFTRGDLLFPLVGVDLGLGVSSETAAFALTARYVANDVQYASQPPLAMFGVRLELSGIFEAHDDEKTGAAAAHSATPPYSPSATPLTAAPLHVGGGAGRVCTSQHRRPRLQRSKSSPRLRASLSNSSTCRSRA
ncbi:MAG TPA: hypothetical protein VER96_41235 [Polyangiaceae bacterium]|nr:hypothetical protein [Polyangiaceae bacterium]